MIMVLSENYLSSEWCRMEFQAAHREMLEGRTKYLIMISLDDVSLKQLPAEMDFYVKTHTYLDASSNWFREKLLYAMPETPLIKIKEQRMQADLYVDMKERVRLKRRFPALFYRMFTYRDGRGEQPEDEMGIVQNEETGEEGNDANELMLFPTRGAVLYVPNKSEVENTENETEL